MTAQGKPSPVARGRGRSGLSAGPSVARETREPLSARAYAAMAVGAALIVLGAAGGAPDARPQSDVFDEMATRPLSGRLVGAKDATSSEGWCSVRRYRLDEEDARWLRRSGSNAFEETSVYDWSRAPATDLGGTPWNYDICGGALADAVIEIAERPGGWLGVRRAVGDEVELVALDPTVRAMIRARFSRAPARDRLIDDLTARPRG